MELNDNKATMKKNLIYIIIVLIAGCSGSKSCSDESKAASENKITLMAYNVLYNSEEIDESIALIENCAPDILCIREMTPKFVKKFKKKFGKKYPNLSFHPRKGTWGVGIASKFPIKRSHHFPIKPHRIPGLQAVIKINEKDVMVSCLHLFPPVGKHLKSDGFFVTLEKNKQLRINQAKYLISKYSGWKGPLIVLGDMNEGPGDGAINIFREANLKRSCDNALTEDCGATFPGATSIFPAVFEIDHILGRKITFKTARVLKCGGSDHYPVLSEITIPK